MLAIQAHAELLHAEPLIGKGVSCEIKRYVPNPGDALLSSCVAVKHRTCTSVIYVDS